MNYGTIYSGLGFFLALANSKFIAWVLEISQGFIAQFHQPVMLQDRDEAVTLRYELCGQVTGLNLNRELGKGHVCSLWAMLNTRHNQMQQLHIGTSPLPTRGQ